MWLNLSITKARGQCYDEAVAMSGCRSGVAKSYGWWTKSYLYPLLSAFFVRVESGLDDLDNLGHFFGGSSGSHPKTKLSGCDPDITCFLENGCWHLVSEWTLGLMNALKYHWCETSLLSQAVLKHVATKGFIFKKSVQGNVYKLGTANVHHV